MPITNGRDRRRPAKMLVREALPGRPQYEGMVRRSANIECMRRLVVCLPRPCLNLNSQV
ncbi:hypothetical protein ACFPRL_24945 [Pseudoclavibacter helvolus]